MLRVEIHDASSTIWLRVQGRFVGAFAEETKAMVLRCKLPLQLVVDLSDVTFVDNAGEQVLLWLAHSGAQFVGNNSYSLNICERLRLPILKRSRCIGPRMTEQPVV